MQRRTPLIAIILAPIALFLLVLLWNNALVPLYQIVWYGETMSTWRLGSDHPEIRVDAIENIGSFGADDPALLEELVRHMQSDPSAEVRRAAANSLGQHGAQHVITDEAIEALGRTVLTAEDDGMLAVAISAVGHSAVKNKYPDHVVERIAGIFSEEHLTWLYSEAAKALGQIGAAQTLPDSVFTTINSLFTDPVRQGERENLANAFTEIAKGQQLPATTLDIIAAAVASESNRRIRIGLMFALAHAGTDYPLSANLLTTLVSDPDPDIVRTAEHGLRIIASNRMFADKDALSLAIDPSEPLKSRLTGLRVLGSSRIDPAAYVQIVDLADDDESEVAVAALGLFHNLARAPTDDFDRSVLIPAMTRAMSDADPLVRYAAYAALSTISLHRPKYLWGAELQAQFEGGAVDPNPKVRVIVLVAMLRNTSRDAERDAIIERAMADPDPYVRRNAVSWMGTPRIQTSKRQAFIAQALSDQDPDVRASAENAVKEWDSRKRSWPIALWQLWQAGDRGKVGMTVLMAVTVVTPVLIGGIFLLYYMARLLTYLQQRRWRAAAVVLVMATWVAASYGMFMLYFVAAFVGDADAGEIAIVAGILWSAIAAYSALGWGMHFLVRR